MEDGGWDNLQVPGVYSTALLSTPSSAQIASGDRYSGLPSASSYCSSSTTYCVPSNIGALLCWEEWDGIYRLNQGRSWSYGHLFGFVTSSAQYTFHAGSGYGLIGSVVSGDIYTVAIDNETKPVEYHRVSLAHLHHISSVKALKVDDCVLEFVIVDGAATDSEMNSAIAKYVNTVKRSHAALR